jgi:hypothetical protein
MLASRRPNQPTNKYAGTSLGAPRRTTQRWRKISMLLVPSCTNSGRARKFKDYLLWPYRWVLCKHALTQKFINTQAHTPVHDHRSVCIPPPPPKHSPCPLTHTHPPCVHRLSQRECGDHKQSKTEAGPVIMIMITIFLFGLGIFSELAEFVVPPPPQLTMPTMFRSCKMVLVVVTRPPQRWWCCWCILTPACMIDRITRAHSVCDFFFVWQTCFCDV